MKTIKIFLASSEELKEERTIMGDLVEHLNYVLNRQGVNIQLIKWEYLDSSMGLKHKQEEYNEKLRECEMCIVLYWTRFGEYTKQELDTAYEGRCAGENPHKLWVYFKNLKETEERMPDLQNFMESFDKQYGHFFCHFENADTLKADFLLQFMEYQNELFKNSSLVETRDSKVFIGGKEYIELKNIPFAGNNEQYNLLLKNIKKTKKLMAVTEVDDPEYSEYAKELKELQDKLAEMESSLWDTALLVTKLSNEKCNERLRRAMQLFHEGDNKGANALQDKEDIRKDALHNQQLIAMGEEGKKGLKTNIEEYELKIKTLENERSEGWYENRSDLRKEILEWTKVLYGEKSLEYADALTKLGESCGSSESLPYYHEALKIQLSLVGEIHPSVAKSYRNIGCAYRGKKRFSELEYLRKALNTNIKLYGENHPEVAECYGYLALAGHSSSLEYYKKALDIFLNVYGENHPAVATCYSGIAGEFRWKDNITALEYYKKAINSAINYWGEKSESLAWDYSNIGGTYEELGDYFSALEYLKKSLKIEILLFGVNPPNTHSAFSGVRGVLHRHADLFSIQDPELEALKIKLNFLLEQFDEIHPDIAKTYCDIGVHLCKQGDYSSALNYHYKALNIWGDEHGEYSTNVANCYFNIGDVLFGQEEYNLAIDNFKKCLEIRMPLYGEKHQDVVLCYNRIGNCYYSLGDKSKALEFYKNTLEEVETYEDENQLLEALSYTNRGVFYEYQGMYSSALEYYKEALKIHILSKNCGFVQKVLKGIESVLYEYDKDPLKMFNCNYIQEAMKIKLDTQIEVLGENNTDVASTCCEIGDRLYKKDKYPSALDYHKKALKIWHDAYGESDANVATGYFNIGDDLYRMKDYSAALDNFKKSLEIRMSLFGENHRDVALCYNRIGICYDTLNDYSKALEHYQKDLSIKLALSCNKDSNIAISYGNIASVYCSLDDYSSAIDNYKKALEIWIDLYGEENSYKVADCYSNIGYALYNQGDYASSLDYFKKKLNIKLEQYGESHCEVAECYKMIGHSLYSQCDYSHALDYHKKALKIWLDAYGENDTNVANGYYDVGDDYYYLDNNSAALENYQQALRIIDENNLALNTVRENVVANIQHINELMD